jgi:type II secretory pathway pseudopilin PulG
MRSRRYSRRSSDARPRGFSLLELLVSFALAGTLLVGVVKFFASQVKGARAHSFRVEAQQAMRGSLDAITRDLRLAGACLPGDGAFTSLTGTNGPGTDSVTIRSGLVRANNQCLRTVTTAAAAGGATSLTVESGADFTQNMLAYVKHPNGSGEFAFVNGMGAMTVTFQTGMTQPYPAGSSVHGVDERIYEVDDQAASRRVEPGEVIVAHLVPAGTRYYVAGAAAHLTEDTRDKLREFAELHLEALRREQPGAGWDDLIGAHSEVLNHFVMQLPVEEPNPTLLENIVTQTRISLKLAGESLGIGKRDAMDE